MRAAAVLGAVFALAQFSHAIFSDDAFHLDSHQALLGIPQPHTTFFHKPQSSSNASLLYTLSDKAFLGAINPKNGSLLWRQALAETEVTAAANAFLVAGDKDGQVISGFGHDISSWDAMDGRLRWQYLLPEESKVLGLRTVPAKTADSAVQDVVFLSGSASGDGAISITRLAGTDGARIWERADSGVAAGSVLFLAVSQRAVFVVAKSHGLLAGSKTKVLELEPATGKETSSHTPAIDSEILAVASCPTDSFIVTSEKPYKSIKVNVLGGSKVTTVSVGDKAEEAQSASVSFSCGSSTPAHFLVHLKSKDRQWAEVLHITPKSRDLVKAYTLPALDGVSTFAAQHTGSEVFFVRTTDTETSLYASSSDARLGTWPFKGTGNPAINAPGLHATAEVISTKSGFAVRVAETSRNGHFSLRRNGEPQWSRPEVLSHTTLASWVNENPQSALVEELETEAAVNPTTAYIHRWSRHLNDLASLPQYIQQIPLILTGSTESAPQTRNRFVGQKVIVLSTNRLDVLALNTDTLAIVWQTSLADIVNGSPTITQLITANGRVTASLSDGSLAVVNVTNGQHIEYLPGSVSAHRVAAIPATPHEAIIKIDADGKPHVPRDLTTPEDGAIVTISEAGTAFGWTIGNEPRRTWTLRPKPGAVFTSAVSRADGEPVASIGTVLGNRAVLYKYISPNLALLTATSAHTITINLVDAVTGSVLHSSSHHGVLAGSPVPAVISENWFAFAYASQDPETSTLSTQLVISEMYESEASNDRGPLSSKLNYSSFSPDAGSKPYIISQAYSVAQPISHLAVTQTGQGITSRWLLAVLPESNAIAAIPREILNARRPVDRDPSRDEQEEGITKYSPLLDIDPRWYLTHSREVMGIEKILATPSLLESTSLIFAFGHDVFSTQIAPSGAFDILGKGFNRIQFSRAEGPATMYDDAAAIASKITSLADDEGKDVVLVMSSYGGFPGTEAAYGLSKATRAKNGLKGGIIALVYLAAFLPTVGDSTKGLTGGMPGEDEYMQLEYSPEFAASIFGDLSDPTEHKRFFDQMTLHSRASFDSTLKHEGWRDVKSYYLHTTNDRIIPPELQAKLIEKAKADGAHVEVTEIDASHVPMLGREQEVVDVLLKAAATVVAP
ncbi:hypothetical protein DV737_g3647, partial [Chaetothyriales sp. CBS 132003]